jgi:hypothetical protein
MSNEHVMDAQTEKKEAAFRHPGSVMAHFGRVISPTISGGGGDLWLSVQQGEAKDTRVLVAHRDRDGEMHYIQGPKGLTHQPCIVARTNGGLSVVWNEATDGGWEIRCANVNPRNHELGAHGVVHRSADLCLPPTAVEHDGKLLIAWSGIAGPHLRIHTTSGDAGAWSQPVLVSRDDVDAFRPHLSSGGGNALLAWDHYDDKRYHVTVARRDGDAWTTIDTLGETDERWFCPKTLVGDDGTGYVTWVVLKAVTDKLGIVDHLPFAMVARVDGDRVEVLYDKNHPLDDHIVADFRDGLLAAEIYKGYVGLRRNPHLSINERGELWCFWELRGESEASATHGYLAGRKLEAGDSWSPLRTFFDTGYCYAVPSRFTGDELTFTYLAFTRKQLDIVSTDTVDLREGKDHPIDEQRWRRWRFQPLTPEAKPQQTVTIGGESYKLVWADTHVHTVYSPDAEGELDELIHFGRDNAGLDVMTLIDNDYYPHKAFTEPEWRVEQDLSAHFSASGDFVWMPGYEFTYHSPELRPDFNHRCVLYPRKGGTLHRRIDPGTDSDHTMIPALKAAGAMPYPHHPTYRIIDPQAEWNVEVTSSWRVCIEESDFTIRQLQQGARLGFIGSSDTHRSIPGYGGARTGIFVKELTPEALMDAYRNRRIFATQGSYMFIDFRVSGAFMGGETSTSGAPHITAIIETPDPLDFVELVRDGDVIQWAQPKGKYHEIDFVDEAAGEGEHFYFLRIKMVGDPGYNSDADPTAAEPVPFIQKGRYPHNLCRARGPFAWSSPVWVTRE